MPDNTPQFQTTSGLSAASLFVSGGATFAGTLSLTGGSRISFVSTGNPDLDMVLASSGTTGSATWEYPAAPVHYSGSNAKYLTPSNSAVLSITPTTAVTGQATYFPFVIYSTVTTRAALLSASSGPTGGAAGGTAGTAFARVYIAGRTSGLPSGSFVGDYGAIGLTATANAIFTSANTVVLNPGQYWVALTFSTSTTQLRRVSADTNAMAKTQGVATPTGTASYTVNFTQTGLTTGDPPPSSVGSVTEGTTTAIVAPMLLIV